MHNYCGADYISGDQNDSNYDVEHMECDNEESLIVHKKLFEELKEKAHQKRTMAMEKEGLKKQKREAI